MRKLLLAFCIVLLTGSLFGQCHPPAGKLILLVPGITGDSSVCRNGIDLSAARINVGGGSSKSAGTMTGTKAIDSSSAVLFLWTANGRHLPEMTLTAPASDGKSNTYKMTDVLISSFRQTASPANEVLTVKFARLEGDEYQPGSAGNPGSFVKVTGPGPYTFQGSTQPAGVQLSMKLDNQDAKITGITFAISSDPRKGRIELQMAVIPSGQEIQSESLKSGEKRYSQGTVTLTRGTTPFASYLLTDVLVKPAGNQTSVEFAKIEFKFGSGARPAGSVNQPGKVGWDIKANKAV